MTWREPDLREPDDQCLEVMQTFDAMHALTADRRAARRYHGLLLPRLREHRSQLPMLAR